MLSYEFHPLAERELDEAVEFYEGILPGKGLELAREVRTAILRVCEFPESAPVVRGTVRSIVVQPDSRWSYTVHYRIKPTRQGVSCRSPSSAAILLVWSSVVVFVAAQQGAAGDR